MFEVWFTYNGARACRGAETVERKDAAVEFLTGSPGVSDIEVIEREDL